MLRLCAISLFVEPVEIKRATSDSRRVSSLASRLRIGSPCQRMRIASTRAPQWRRVSSASSSARGLQRERLEQRTFRLRELTCRLKGQLAGPLGLPAPPSDETIEQILVAAPEAARNRALTCNERGEARKIRCGTQARNPAAEEQAMVERGERVNGPFEQSIVIDTALFVLVECAKGFDERAEQPRSFACEREIEQRRIPAKLEQRFVAQHDC